MPSLGFPRLTYDDLVLFLGPDSALDVPLSVANLGATFDLTHTVDGLLGAGGSPVVIPQTSALYVDVGVSSSLTLTVDLVGSQRGETYLLGDVLALVVVSPEAACAYDAAAGLQAVGEDLLAAHVNVLAAQVETMTLDPAVMARRDAVLSAPTSLTPYQPLVEWYDNESGGASWWGGIHVLIVAGDVTGDGNVELVVAASTLATNGELLLYRGDGADTGDGIPDDQELADGLNLLTSADAFGDEDGDGLPLVVERALGLDPAKEDTDNDGRNDNDEVAAGTGPATYLFTA